MSRYNFDEIDIGLLVGALFSTAVIVELATFSAFGVSMSDTFSLAGYTAPIAWVVSVGAFAATVVTNDNAELSTDLYGQLEDDLPRNYFLAVIGTAAVLVAWPFIPQVSEFVTSADLWGVIYLFAVAAGQLAVGWML